MYLGLEPCDVSVLKLSWILKPRCDGSECVTNRHAYCNY